MNKLCATCTSLILTSTGSVAGEIASNDCALESVLCMRYDGILDFNLDFQLSSTLIYI